MNQGPLDLQSNALPLSYTPILHAGTVIYVFMVYCMTSWYNFLVQFVSRYHPGELLVFLEQLVGLRSFLERNPKLFATPSEKLR